MPSYCDRAKPGNIRFRHIVSWALAAIFALESLAAVPAIGSDKWSRLTGLKEDTRVYVTLTDGTYVEGRFFTADTTCITVGVPEGDMAIPRDRVMQVAISHSGRRWYSIPLALVAGAGGLAAGYGITSRIRCATDSETCGRGRGIILGAFAGGAAGLVYRSTLGPSKKVIYTKTSKSGYSSK